MQGKWCIAHTETTSANYALVEYDRRWRRLQRSDSLAHFRVPPLLAATLAPTSPTLRYELCSCAHRGFCEITDEHKQSDTLELTRKLELTEINNCKILHHHLAVSMLTCVGLLTLQFLPPLVLEKNSGNKWNSFCCGPQVPVCYRTYSVKNLLYSRILQEEDEPKVSKQRRETWAVTSTRKNQPLTLTDWYTDRLSTQQLLIPLRQLPDSSTQN